jgi:hypothetical protein
MLQEMHENNSTWHNHAERMRTRNVCHRKHIFIVLVEQSTRDISGGTETGYGLDDRRVGVRVSVGSRIFSSPCRSSGVHPASYPMETAGLSPEVKRPGRQADHSPPANAEVKKMWIYNSTHPYAFMA